MAIDEKNYFEYLSGLGDDNYILDPDEDHLKYKSDYLMKMWKTSVADLQYKTIRATHQITLKHVYNNCKEELMQYKDSLEALPWTVQKELASDATKILCYCHTANLMKWVKKILPVSAHINDQKKLVIDFQDKKPRFIDLYFFLIHHYLVTAPFEDERVHDIVWDLGGCGGIMMDFTCPKELSFLNSGGLSIWDDMDEFLNEYEKKKLINPEFSYL